jgi:uncharacterized membrane protein
MQHQHSEGSRTGRTVLGFQSFVILIGVPLLATVALAQIYPAMPTAPPPNTYRPSQRHIVRGAGRGAALGAVGGAITGNAGKGAAAGAAMGGMVGAFRRRDERRQYGGRVLPAQ